MFDGKTIHTLHFTSLDSTNTWANQHAADLDATALTCITADAQSAGYGQHARPWYSPPLGNLYTTFFFVLPKDFRWTANLSQLLSLSTAEALHEYGMSPSLKWPNDILLREKKAGGVLCETHLRVDGLAIVIGLGLNVFISQDQLSHIDQPATSLAAHSQNLPTLSALLQTILRNFLRNLQILRQDGFSPFVNTYNDLLAFKDQAIILTTPEGALTGICKRIDPEGRLVIACADGLERHFASGTLRRTMIDD